MLHRPAVPVVFLSVAALVGLSCQRSPRSPAKNFVVITLDTVRADHLGVYGHAAARTPSLDALAKSGVRFNTAISVAPVTLPTHASIFTGLYPFRHGVRNNGSFRLDEAETTLAERFSAAGYDTAAVVSALVLDSKFGLAQGFRIYDDDLNAGAEQKMFMFKEIKAERAVDKALAIIPQLTEPFFLWLHLFDAHADYDPPPPYDVLFYENPYDGEIAYIDAELGRLFAALDRTGLRERSLLQVVADHGDSLGDHGEKTHGIFIYRSTTHVPWIVSGPGIKPNIVGDVVSQVDFAPTLAQLAGLPAIPSDGVSLARVIQRGAAPPQRDGVLIEALNPRLHFGWHELRAVDEGSLKLIEAPTRELYDLAIDPNESKNLYASSAVRAGKMRAQLDAWIKEDDLSRLHLRSVDGSTRAMLEALGYVGDASVVRGDDLPDPKDVVHRWASLQRCQALVRQKMQTEGRSCLESVLAEDPGNWTARLTLTGVLQKLGDFVAAERVVREALELDPGSVKALENLAAILGKTGRRDEAIALLRKATEVNPQDPEPWVALGDTQLDAGDADASIIAYGKALALDDRYAQTYVGIANAYNRSGRLERAAKYLDRAVEIDPRNLAAWYNRGVVLDGLGEHERSEEAYKAALKIDPSHTMTHNNLGSLYIRLGRSPEAQRELRLALQSDPNHVEALFNLGTQLIDQRPAVAAGFLRRAVDLKPELVIAHINLAAALERLGQADAALAQYQWVVDQLELAPGPLISMARIEASRGKITRAKKLLRRAIAQGGDKARQQIEQDKRLARLVARP